MSVHSSQHDRTMKKLPSTSRRRCGCGCRRRSTHVGLAQGGAMTDGCEFSIRLWVKGGYAAIIRMRKGKK